MSTTLSSPSVNSHGQERGSNPALEEHSAYAVDQRSDRVNIVVAVRIL